MTRVLQFPGRGRQPEQTKPKLWLLTFGGPGIQGYALVWAMDADDAESVWGAGWTPEPPDLEIVDRTELSTDTPVPWATLSRDGSAA